MIEQGSFSRVLKKHRVNSRVGNAAIRKKLSVLFSDVVDVLENKLDELELLNEHVSEHICTLREQAKLGLGPIVGSLTRIFEFSGIPEFDELHDKPDLYEVAARRAHGHIYGSEGSFMNPAEIKGQPYGVSRGRKGRVVRKPEPMS